MDSATDHCPNCGESLKADREQCRKCGATYGRNRSFLIGAVAFLLVGIGLWRESPIVSIAIFMAAAAALWCWTRKSWKIEIED